jgi:glycosyltransferase involved in cell wall biosynthesis
MSCHFRALFVLPSFARNGAVDFIVDLADAMACQSCEVEILVLSGDTVPARGPKEPVTVSIANGYTSTRNSRSKFMIQIQRAYHILSMFKDVMRSVLRADVVILTWEYGRALLLPSIAAFILRKPTIAIVQNNVQRSISDYSSAGWQRVLRWAYARARAVVCISHDQIAMLHEVGVLGSNLVTIPNGVDVERIRTLAKHLPPSVLTVDDIPFVVSMGRLSSQKGYDILIRAHAEVLRRGFKHRLVLIGYGPDKDKLAALAAELDVGDSILFLGYQTNPYPTVLRSSVYCLSSRFEGRPLVLAEAALLGVPMIASDCPTGPREILADGLYGDLVESESVEALTTAIEQHFRDPQRLIDKSQAAKEDSDRFSIQVCAKSYVSLIRQHLR